jgi:uncharacterized protein YciI
VGKLFSVALPLVAALGYDGIVMHYFIVELTYTVSFDALADTLPEHRQFLQAAYDNGAALFSGPQLPRTGGIIVARFPSRQEIEAFFANDPFQRKGLATYRFIEFDPVKRQSLVEGWLTSH